MPLPELLRALREQAANRCAAELSRADAAADRIRVESDAVLQHRRTELISRIRREGEAAAHRALSRAQVEAAQSVLAARSRFLDRVKSAVDARIARADRDPDYLGSLPGELRSSLDRLPAGPVVVRTLPSLVSPVTDAVGDFDIVTVEPARTMGTGFKASSRDEGVEVDGTLETRVEHAWPRLAVAVLAEADT
jgi:vacuolar-type H+-ATPase subunit E/Vma4